jgi:hypothetical protein
MPAEALAFADAFGHTFILKHDLHLVLGREVSLLMLTDSKMLFDIITGNKYTTEKRLMADASILEAYNDRKISNIALIRSEHNAADAMTKIAQNAALQEILHAHRVLIHFSNISSIQDCSPTTARASDSVTVLVQSTNFVV